MEGMSMRRGTSFPWNMFFLSFLFLFLVGCMNDSAEDSADYNTSVASNDNSAAGVNESRDERSSSLESEEETQASQESPNTDASAMPDQMVIYNGDISIAVDSYQETQSFIQQETEELGGFVVESSVYQQGEDEEQQGSIIVRIPQEHFHSFMNELESNSVALLEKSTHGNDVTEEFVDLESRLRSKEAVEERLTAFLEEADNTEDLLKISQDLSVVQEEIEQTVGRMSYLENHVAFSTVTIQIQERTVNVSSLQDRESLNTLEHAQSLFMDTINVLITIFSRIFIFIVGLSPVLIPLAITAAFIFWLLKRKNRVKNEV